MAETRQVWHPKDKPDDDGHSAEVAMAFFLPADFMAPEDQHVEQEIYSDFDETEFQSLLAQVMLGYRLPGGAAKGIGAGSDVPDACAQAVLALLISK